MADNTPGQPHVFTLGEAAKAAGVSKPTLSKAIATGRLSAEKKPNGSYTIQPAELFRVYPPNRKGNGEAGGKLVHGATPVAGGLSEVEVDRLRERLDTLGSERERERHQLIDQIEDLRRRLDREGDERRKLTAVLTDQRPKPPEPAPQPPARGVSRGFWSLFTRRG